MGDYGVELSELLEDWGSWTEILQITLIILVGVQTPRIFSYSLNCFIHLKN